MVIEIVNSLKTFYVKKEDGLNKAFEAVKAFHFAFNHPVGVAPQSLDFTRKRHRANWMMEEIGEFLGSARVEDQADAMIDLIYFALGTLVEMGVEPENLFNIVQSANMAKLWADGKPHYKPDGKVMKPDSWEDPRDALIAEISRQINLKKELHK